MARMALIRNVRAAFFREARMRAADFTCASAEEEAPVLAPISLLEHRISALHNRGRLAGAVPEGRAARCARSSTKGSKRGPSSVPGGTAAPSWPPRPRERALGAVRDIPGNAEVLPPGDEGRANRRNADASLRSRCPSRPPLTADQRCLAHSGSLSFVPRSGVGGAW